MDLMIPDSGLLFWMTIIFALVFFILAKFGFPIITGMVEKRAKRINDSLEAARIAEEALANLQNEQERLISQTRAEQTRLMQEAAAERNIADIAADIIRKHRQFVLIAGPSSSGKTSFSNRLAIQLEAQGLSCHTIAQDDYFCNRDEIGRASCRERV